MADAVELVIRAKNETTGAISEAKANLTDLSRAATDTVQALSQDMPPIAIEAVDKTGPVLDEIKRKVESTAGEVKPIELGVGGDNWRAPIDAMQARLDQMIVKARGMAQEASKLQAAPINLSAVDNATPVIESVGQALGSVDGVAKGAAQALGGFGSALSAIGAAAGVAGIVALAQKLGEITWNLGETGAGFEELSLASEALGVSFGVNSRAMLAAMKQAADGTVSDSELMIAANRAIVTGVTTDAGTMSRLMVEAKARADAFGLSSGAAFDILVTGIGNAAPRMLKQLGYTIDLTQANEEYARSIGTTADQLTEQQQRVAILNAALGQSGKIPAVDSAADSFERMDAAIQNAKDALGVLFGPAVAAVAQTIADMANGATRAFQDMDTGVSDSLATTGQKLGDYKAQLTELNALRAEQVGLNAPTATTDNDISRVQVQIAAFIDLQNAIKQASDAYRNGVPGAGEYLQKLNDIATAAQNQQGLTAGQSATVNALAAALSQAAASADAMSAAEGGLGASVAATNPLLDEQTSKLKALWIAAAGALGAQAAFDGYKKNVEEAGKQQQLFDQLRRTGLSLPDQEFIDAQSLADVKKQVDDLVKTSQEPITIKVAVQGVATSAAQKAYQEALKAGGDVGAATVAANQAAIEVTNEVNRQVEAWQAAGYNINEISNYLIPGMRQQLTATGGAAKAVNKEFDNLKSKVASVLQGALDPGVGVNPKDILEKMGLREDAVNEQARRLADIAQNGLKDQEWLPQFKTQSPGLWADLMLAQAKGGDIRAAAARILQDFQDGLRPDLLDKGKAKELVKRALIGDANTAALAQEIATELSQELGVSLQAAQEAANTALGVPTKGGQTAQQQLSIAPIINFGEGAQEEAKKLGNTIKEGLASESSLKALAEAAKSAAQTWGAAFLGKVSETVPPELIDLLTTLITPKVQAQLAAAGTQTGAQP